MENRDDAWEAADGFDEAVRAEAADVEADAETARRRGRTLAGSVADLAARGDRVAVACGDVRLAGRVVGVGEDLAVLLAGDTEASVNLAGPVVVSLVEESRTGGVLQRGGSRSFRARLLEFELSGEPVTVVGSTFVEEGVIGSVAADHVVVDRGSGEMYVPFGLVGFVTRPTPRSPRSG